MTYTPRPLTDIQNTFLEALAFSNSDLNLDLNQGSILNALSRAASSGALRMDLDLLSLDIASSISTATDTDLDRIGRDLVLPREGATFSSGSVSLISLDSSTVVPANTVLTELGTGLQYRTTTQITVPTVSEIVTPITAIQVGVDSNLAAGTLLYIENYPSIIVKVGVKNSLGYSGDLIGGSSTESDGVYRTRLLTYLTSAGSCSKSKIELALLAYENVGKAFALTRVPGFCEIWVDSISTFSNTDLTNLLNYIKPFLASGIIPIVNQTTRKLVNYTLNVKPFNISTVDLNSLNEQIYNLVFNKIDALEVGQGLSNQAIISAVSPIVRSVEVILPTISNTAAYNELLILNDLKITYPSISG